MLSDRPRLGNQYVDANRGTPRQALLPLRLACIDFLGRLQWHWFCTFTFDPKHAKTPQGLIHPEKAVKAFRFFVRTDSMSCVLPLNPLALHRIGRHTPDT